MWNSIFELYLDNNFVQLILNEINEQLRIKQVHRSVVSLTGRGQTMFTEVRNMSRTLINVRITIPNSSYKLRSCLINIHIFFLFGLLGNIFSNSYHKVLKLGRLIMNWKAVKGTGHSLIWITIMESEWRDWGNYEEHCQDS